MLTREEVQKALPANLKSAATQQLTDLINNVASDPLVAEQVRHNFISYTSVLKEGKFKTEDYLNAVHYVSYKLMGCSNQDAYAKTFPQRHQALVAKGTSAKDYAAYVHSYSKNKLVSLVMEQSAIPTWVLNQDIFQAAINTQADLMKNAMSEKVRCEAANSLLTHLKRPEVKEMAVRIGVEESSGMNELKATLTQLAQRQIELIENGASPKQIAAQPLVNGEYVEVEQP